MATETERKFLVKGNSWNDGIPGKEYKQAYILSTVEKTVRVRIVGDQGFITIKGGAKENSLSHPEFEYPIPLADAEELLKILCEPGSIEKTRYKIPYHGHIWEIDVFHGANEGLIVAEVELQDENEEVIFPTWIGAEVSHDARYYNALLLKQPFTTWNK